MTTRKTSTNPLIENFFTGKQRPLSIDTVNKWYLSCLEEIFTEPELVSVEEVLERIEASTGKTSRKHKLASCSLTLMIYYGISEEVLKPLRAKMNALNSDILDEKKEKKMFEEKEELPSFSEMVEKIENYKKRDKFLLFVKLMFLQTLRGDFIMAKINQIDANGILNLVQMKTGNPQSIQLTDEIIDLINELADGSGYIIPDMGEKRSSGNGMNTRFANQASEKVLKTRLGIDDLRKINARKHDDLIGPAKNLARAENAQKMGHSVDTQKNFYLN